MTVYVDDMMAPFRGMLMCHMFATDFEELHAMACRIRIKREWFQDWDKASYPHYDVSTTKRKLAIQHGAVIVTWRQAGAMCFLARAGGVMGDPATAVDRMLAVRERLKLSHGYMRLPTEGLDFNGIQAQAMEEIRNGS
jgi:hypothetical protein